MKRFSLPFTRDLRRLPAVPFCPYCGMAHMTHGQFVECCGQHGGYDPDPKSEFAKTEEERYRQAMGQNEQ